MLYQDLTKIFFVWYCTNLCFIKTWQRYFSFDIAPICALSRLDEDIFRLILHQSVLYRDLTKIFFVSYCTNLCFIKTWRRYFSFDIAPICALSRLDVDIFRLILHQSVFYQDLTKIFFVWYCTNLCFIETWRRYFSFDIAPICALSRLDKDIFRLILHQSVLYRDLTKIFFVWYCTNLCFIETWRRYFSFDIAPICALSRLDEDIFRLILHQNVLYRDLTKIFFVWYCTNLCFIETWRRYFSFDIAPICALSRLDEDIFRLILHQSVLYRDLTKIFFVWYCTNLCFIETWQRYFSFDIAPICALSRLDEDIFRLILHQSVLYRDLTKIFFVWYCTNLCFIETWRRYFSFDIAPICVLSRFDEDIFRLILHQSVLYRDLTKIFFVWYCTNLCFIETWQRYFSFDIAPICALSRLDEDIFRLILHQSVLYRDLTKIFFVWYCTNLCFIETWRRYFSFDIAPKCALSRLDEDIFRLILHQSVLYRDLTKIFFVWYCTNLCFIETWRRYFSFDIAPICALSRLDEDIFRLILHQSVLYRDLTKIFFVWYCTNLCFIETWRRYFSFDIAPICALSRLDEDIFRLILHQSVLYRDLTKIFFVWYCTNLCFIETWRRYFSFDIAPICALSRLDKDIFRLILHQSVFYQDLTKIFFVWYCTNLCFIETWRRYFSFDIAPICALSRLDKDIFRLILHQSVFYQDLTKIFFVWYCTNLCFIETWRRYFSFDIAPICVLSRLDEDIFRLILHQSVLYRDLTKIFFVWYCTNLCFIKIWQRYFSFDIAPICALSRLEEDIFRLILHQSVFYRDLTKIFFVWYCTNLCFIETWQRYFSFDIAPICALSRLDEDIFRLILHQSVFYRDLTKIFFVWYCTNLCFIETWGRYFSFDIAPICVLSRLDEDIFRLILHQSVLYRDLTKIFFVWYCTNLCFIETWQRFFSFDIAPICALSRLDEDIFRLILHQSVLYRDLTKIFFVWYCTNLCFIETWRRYFSFDIAPICALSRLDEDIFRLILHQSVLYRDLTKIFFVWYCTNLCFIETWRRYFSFDIAPICALSRLDEDICRLILHQSVLYRDLTKIFFVWYCTNLCFIETWRRYFSFDIAPICALSRLDEDIFRLILHQSVLYRDLTKIFFVWYCTNLCFIETWQRYFSFDIAPICALSRLNEDIFRLILHQSVLYRDLTKIFFVWYCTNLCFIKTWRRYFSFDIAPICALSRLDEDIFRLILHQSVLYQDLTKIFFVWYCTNLCFIETWRRYFSFDIAPICALSRLDEDIFRLILHQSVLYRDLTKIFFVWYCTNLCFIKTWQRYFSFDIAPICALSRLDEDIFRLILHQSVLYRDLTKIFFVWYCTNLCFIETWRRYFSFDIAPICALSRLDEDIFRLILHQSVLYRDLTKIFFVWYCTNLCFIETWRRYFSFDIAPICALSRLDEDIFRLILHQSVLYRSLDQSVLYRDLTKIFFVWYCTNLCFIETWRRYFSFDIAPICALSRLDEDIFRLILHQSVLYRDLTKIFFVWYCTNLCFIKIWRRYFSFDIAPICALSRLDEDIFRLILHQSVLYRDLTKIFFVWYCTNLCFIETWRRYFSFDIAPICALSRLDEDIFRLILHQSVLYRDLTKIFFVWYCTKCALSRLDEDIFRLILHQSVLYRDLTKIFFVWYCTNLCFIETWQRYFSFDIAPICALSRLDEDIFRLILHQSVLYRDLTKIFFVWYCTNLCFIETWRRYFSFDIAPICALSRLDEDIFRLILHQNVLYRDLTKIFFVWYCTNLCFIETWRRYFSFDIAPICALSRLDEDIFRLILHQSVLYRDLTKIFFVWYCTNLCFIETWRRYFSFDIAPICALSRLDKDNFRLILHQSVFYQDLTKIFFVWYCTNLCFIETWRRYFSFDIAPICALSRLDEDIFRLILHQSVLYRDLTKIFFVWYCTNLCFIKIWQRYFSFDIAPICALSRLEEDIFRLILHQSVFYRDLTKIFFVWYCTNLCFIETWQRYFSFDIAPICALSRLDEDIFRLILHQSVFYRDLTKIFFVWYCTNLCFIETWRRYFSFDIAPICALSRLDKDNFRLILHQSVFYQDLTKIFFVWYCTNLCFIETWRRYFSFDIAPICVLSRLDEDIFRLILHQSVLYRDLTKIFFVWYCTNLCFIETWQRYFSFDIAPICALSRLDEDIFRLIIHQSVLYRDLTKIFFVWYCTNLCFIETWGRYFSFDIAPICVLSRLDEDIFRLILHQSVLYRDLTKIFFVWYCTNLCFIETWRRYFSFDIAPICALSRLDEDIFRLILHQSVLEKYRDLTKIFFVWYCTKMCFIETWRRYFSFDIAPICALSRLEEDIFRLILHQSVFYRDLTKIFFVWYCTNLCFIETWRRYFSFDIAPICALSRLDKDIFRLILHQSVLYRDLTKIFFVWYCTNLCFIKIWRRYFSFDIAPICALSRLDEDIFRLILHQSVFYQDLTKIFFVWYCTNLCFIETWRRYFSFDIAPICALSRLDKDIFRLILHQSVLYRDLTKIFFVWYCTNLCFIETWRRYFSFDIAPICALSRLDEDIFRLILHQNVLYRDLTKIFFVWYCTNLCFIETWRRYFSFDIAPICALSRLDEDIFRLILHQSVLYRDLTKIFFVWYCTNLCFIETWRRYFSFDIAPICTNLCTNCASRLDEDIFRLILHQSVWDLTKIYRDLTKIFFVWYCTNLCFIEIWQRYFSFDIAPICALSRLDDRDLTKIFFVWYCTNLCFIETWHQIFFVWYCTNLCFIRDLTKIFFVWYCTNLCFIETWQRYFSFDIAPICALSRLDKDIFRLILHQSVLYQDLTKIFFVWYCTNLCFIETWRRYFSFDIAPICALSRLDEDIFRLILHQSVLYQDLTKIFFVWYCTNLCFIETWRRYFSFDIAPICVLSRLDEDIFRLILHQSVLYRDLTKIFFVWYCTNLCFIETWRRYFSFDIAPICALSRLDEDIFRLILHQSVLYRDLTKIFFVWYCTNLCFIETWRRYFSFDIAPICVLSRLDEDIFRLILHQSVFYRDLTKIFFVWYCTNLCFIETWRRYFSFDIAPICALSRLDEDIFRLILHQSVLYRDLTKIFFVWYCTNLCFIETWRRYFSFDIAPICALSRLDKDIFRLILHQSVLYRDLTKDIFRLILHQSVFYQDLTKIFFVWYCTNLCFIETWRRYFSFDIAPICVLSRLDEDIFSFDIAPICALSRLDKDIFRLILHQSVFYQDLTKIFFVWYCTNLCFIETWRRYFSFDIAPICALSRLDEDIFRLILHQSVLYRDLTKIFFVWYCTNLCFIETWRRYFSFDIAPICALSRLEEDIFRLILHQSVFYRDLTKIFFVWYCTNLCFIETWQRYFSFDIAPICALSRLDEDIFRLILHPICVLSRLDEDIFRLILHQSVLYRDLTKIFFVWYCTNLCFIKIWQRYFSFDIAPICALSRLDEDIFRLIIHQSVLYRDLTKIFFVWYCTNLCFIETWRRYFSFDIAPICALSRLDEDIFRLILHQSVLYRDLTKIFFV